MSEFKRVDIICECGRLIDSKRIIVPTHENRKSTKTCPNCKKDIEYTITNDGDVYINYK